MNESKFPSIFCQFMSIGLTSSLLAKCSNLMHKKFDLIILVGSIYPDTMGLYLNKYASKYARHRLKPSLIQCKHFAINLMTKTRILIYQILIRIKSVGIHDNVCRI